MTHLDPMLVYLASIAIWLAGIAFFSGIATVFNVGDTDATVLIVAGWPIALPLVAFFAVGYYGAKWATTPRKPRVTHPYDTEVAA